MKHRPPVIRSARPGDIDHLLDIEKRSFTSDRLSPKSLRRFLTQTKARCLVAVEGRTVLAYALVLFPPRAAHARLYSFAVDPSGRGRGIGKRLLAAAEQAARDGDRTRMRLEVRDGNDVAIQLYQNAGYAPFGRIKGFYDDGAHAIRMEKTVAAPNRPQRRMPYYEQTLEFTCGPAALLMAMASIKPDRDVSRREELTLWRESTLIFMTSGHGGCDPYGLALAAHKRGFDARVFVNVPDDLFLDSVRSPQKREVMRLVQRDFRDALAERKVEIHTRPVKLKELTDLIGRGAVPLVLVSGYRFFRQKAPHWVVMTGCDDSYVYIHDPYVRRRTGMTAADSMDIPVPRRDFERMTRYGKAKLQAALVLSAPTGRKRKR
jgi:ribosomal protein S18 acetylase RimI-like enzyme